MILPKFHERIGTTWLKPSIDGYPWGELPIYAEKEAYSMKEILAVIATMSDVWDVNACFAEAYHDLVSAGRIKPDGPVCMALAEYCGIVEVSDGD